MKKSKRGSAMLVVTLIIGYVLLLLITIFTARPVQSQTAEVITAEPVKVWVDPLTHEQRIWLGALEWCESKGKGDALNKVDKDGTASYWWFQFKLGSFRGFGVKYGLIEKGKTDAEIMVLMKDYELTNAIMEKMVLDKTITAKMWRYQLFPGCVAKLGTPPLSPLKELTSNNKGIQ